MPTPRPPLRAGDVAAVAVGGAVGALLRWSLTLVVDGVAAAAAANLVGSLAMGALMAWTAGRGPHRLRPLVGVGVLGGFTTFSTYATDVVGLLHDGDPAGPVLLVATPVTAVLAAAAGAWAVRAAVGRTVPTTAPAGDPR